MKTIRTVTTTTRFPGALLAAGLLLGGFFAGKSTAAEAVEGKTKSPLAIALTAQKVVKEADGKEKFLAADRAFPGEVIQYDALYQNQGLLPLNNVSPTLPIPAGMVFLADSATPAPLEASLDGKTFERIPLKRKVTMPSGETQEQEVPANEYRALRWQLGEMAPGVKATFVARTRIASSIP